MRYILKIIKSRTFDCCVSSNAWYDDRNFLINLTNTISTHTFSCAGYFYYRWKFISYLSTMKTSNKFKSGTCQFNNIERLFEESFNVLMAKNESVVERAWNINSSRIRKNPSSALKGNCIRYYLSVELNVFCHI